MRRKEGNHWLVVGPALLLLTLLVCSQAGAQGTTASIGGTVSDKRGPLPGATVAAKNVQTAFVYKVTAGEDGRFLLGGLPPGTYELMVYSEAYKPASQTVTVFLGQANKVNFVLTPEKVFVGEATVVGEATKVLVDTRSSVVATNITPEQMQTLPMNNRNFLAFSALAPGISFTQDTDAQGQYFSSGGAKPEQVNVFIDGLSYKNDIIKGGAFMQDSVRGNPFPQNAVQEYRVMTQNFKAEYEQASAAVITAVTKSGGNVFHGDLFFLYQNKSMVTQDDFAKARGDAKPPYTRKQFGLSLGGPIIKDKLNFFVSFEGTNRDVVSSVFHGGSYGQAPANVKAILDPYGTGALSSPFTSRLYFGKLSWQPSTAQTLDLSYNKRDESDIRGFGGQTTKDAAQNFKVKTDAAVLRHQLMVGNNTLNEGSLTWQKMEWIQGTPASNQPELNYLGLLQVGGSPTTQDLTQKKVGLRDDLTYFADWHGSHTLKVGFTANWMKYDMVKDQVGNPLFEFRSDDNWQYPFHAQIGFGNPALAFDNTQYGLYAQDDWTIASNLTINAGVRWDYETNMLNNNWVTPASVISGLQSACRHYDQPIGGKNDWCLTDVFNINDYISTGSNRKSYKGMVQPRLGFSWDPSGNGKTVVFGGWGLYYDRIPLNDIYDEQFRHRWGIYDFCFTNDPAKVGVPGAVGGCNAAPILWDPSYQSAAGLRGLIASGVQQGYELFLLNNNTHPPRSTQWNLGLRQQLGDWLASFTYANSRGYNGLVWSFGALPPGTPFNDRWGDSIPIPGYGFTMRGYDLRKTWYDGYILTLDKPYTSDSRWGFDLAYTYADAKQQASTDDGVAFAFDSLPPHFATFQSVYTEKQKLIMSGTVGLPAGFTVSGIVTLSSGLPFYYTDCRKGYDQCFTAAQDPPKQSFLGIKQFAYRSVDLRAEWDAKVAGDFRLGLIGEAFNVFNFANDSCFDGWTGGPGGLNAHFSQPTCQFNTRRFQVGAKVSF
ncbi:MAG: TonB-dependent receptor [Acidobacteria bacterium]|nr:MAG: TonB-dependent receptor [Acidobacteriota bacterium]